MKNRRVIAPVASICLIAVLAMSLLVVACAKPAPAPAPTPAPAPAPTPAPVTPITLKWSVSFPEADQRTKGWQHYADVVSQKSGGRLSLKIFVSQSLAKAAEEFTMAADGTIDVACLVASYVAGKVPFLNNAALPFYATLEQFDAFVNKVAPLNSKYLAQNDLQYLYGTLDGYMHMIHRSKFLKSPADWQGQKMRMAGGYHSTFAGSMGSGVVTVTAAEQYVALKTGTVDGTVTSSASYMSYKLNEVAPFVVVSGMLSNIRLVSINKHKWDSIPPDLQKVMLDAAPEAQSYAIRLTQDFEKQTNDELAKLGAKVYTLTPSEKAQYLKVAAPLFDDFASKGPDYKAFVDIVREFQQK